MRLPACVRSWPARHAIAIDGSDEASVSSNNSTRRGARAFDRPPRLRRTARRVAAGDRGRRAGTTYGRRGRRPLPARVDETYAAPLPVACPRCGGAIQATRVATQYQEDPARRPANRAAVQRSDRVLRRMPAPRAGPAPAANLRRLGRGRRTARSWRRDVYGPVAQTRGRAAGEDRNTAAGPVRADGHAGRTCSSLASRGPGSGAHVRGSLRSDPGESRRQSG